MQDSTGGQPSTSAGTESSLNVLLPGAPSASGDLGLYLDEDLSEVEMLLFPRSDLPSSEEPAGRAVEHDSFTLNGSQGGSHELMKTTSTFRAAAVLMQEASVRRDLDAEGGGGGAGETTKNRKAWFYPALHWGLPPDVDTPQHGAVFLQAWDVIIAISCLYQGFMVPFSLCFEKIYIEKDAGQSGQTEQCLFSENVTIRPSAPFYVTRNLDLVVDVLFILDIVLNFLSARWVLEVEPMEHWFLYEDLQDVARMYLRDTFFMDALGSLPVQYLDCIPNTSAGQIKLLRLLRMIKLLRLNRLQQLAKALQTKFPTSVYFTTFTQLLTVFFLFAHVSACVFFYFAYGMADPHGSEYDQYLFTNGWVHKDGILDDDGEVVEHAGSPWVSSFYWAVTTMSTIGYGDISPGTEPERVLAMFLMAAGCSFFAWVTGKITQLLTQRPACEDRFESIIGDLEAFMNARMIPPILRNKIRNYYKVRYPSKRVFDEGAIIHDIESPFLKKDIVLHLFHDLEHLVPLFKLLDEDARKEICFKLRSIYRMPGRIVTYAGAVPDSMYIIRFGKVATQGSGFRNRMLTQGDIFGEMALMGLTPDGLRCRTSTCMTVVELCELTVEDFQDLLRTRPGLLNLLREVSKMHVQYLNLAYEQAGQKGTPAVGDFFDSLCHLNWRGICNVIRDRQICEKIRNEDSTFKEERIAEMESTSGRQVLRTSIEISFRRLQCKTSSFPGGKGMAMIVCSWPGVHGLPHTTVQNETKTFRLEGSRKSGDMETIDVRDSVVLPIVTPADEPLTSSNLPPVNIRILSSLSGGNRALSTQNSMWKSFFGSPGEQDAVAAQSSDSNTIDEPPKNSQVKSKFSKEAKPVYDGQISLHDIVKHASGSSRQQVFLSLGPTRSPSGQTITVTVSFRMRRIPRSKYWCKILPLLTAKGASDYFVRKMGRVLKEVEEREDAFSVKMRSERIRHMLLRPENQKVDDNSELGIEKGAGSIEELLSKLNTRMDRMEMDMFAAPGPAPLKPESISLRQSHERQNQQLQTVTPTAITTLLEEIRSLKTSVEHVRSIQHVQSAQLQKLAGDRAQERTQTDENFTHKF